MSNQCKYVQRHYGVPAEIGRQIIFRGRPGIIAKDRGHYIGVNFDADKPGQIYNVHPTDGVEYRGIGKVRKMTRSQRRYQGWIRSENGLTFSEHLGVPRAVTCGVGGR